MLNLRDLHDLKLNEGLSCDLKLNEGLSCDLKLNEGLSCDLKLNEGLSCDLKLNEGLSCDVQLNEAVSHARAVILSVLRCNECTVNVDYLQCLLVSPWLPSVGAVQTCWVCCDRLNRRGESVQGAAEDHGLT